jgi:hypothetical protein
MGNGSFTDGMSEKVIKVCPLAHSAIAVITQTSNPILFIGRTS